MLLLFAFWLSGGIKGRLHTKAEKNRKKIEKKKLKKTNCEKLAAFHTFQPPNSA